MYLLPQNIPLEEILEFGKQHYDIIGNRNCFVSGIAAIGESEKGALCFCSSKDPHEALSMISSAEEGAVIVVWRGLPYENLAHNKTLILVEAPRRWFVNVVGHLFPEPNITEIGISPHARISLKAHIGENVCIGAYSVIEDGVNIGPGSVLGTGVHVMKNVQIGSGVVVQSNSVLGATGLACERGDDGVFVRLPHLGTLIVKDNTHIGPGCTLIRGTMQDTIVGSGCIIGSQVNIGHNCEVGNNCFLATAVVIAGSVFLEDECWLAPRVTVLNKTRLKRSTVVAIGSVVHRDSIENDYLVGNPARSMPHLKKSERF